VSPHEAGAWLLRIRRAVAVGDTRTARELLQQARARGVDAGPQGDSLRKVEDLIARQEALRPRLAENPRSEALQRQAAQLFLEQAEWLIRHGDLDEAERLVRDAQKYPVTYSMYEANPATLLGQIQDIRQTIQRPQPAWPAASGAHPAAAYPPAQQAMYPAPQGALPTPQGNWPAPAVGDRYANQAVFQQQPGAASYVRPVQGLGDPGPGPAPAFGAPTPAGGPPGVQGLPAPAGVLPAPPADNEAMRLAREAEAALQSGNPDRARQLFLQAEKMQDQLDPPTRNLVRGRLDFLGRVAGNVPIDAQAQQQEMLRRQVAANLANAQRRARNVMQAYPKEALRILEAARAELQQSGLDPESLEALLRRVDGDIVALHRYIEDHRPRIELDERNAAVRADIERERQHKVEVQQRLAMLVNEFNQLMDQRRFAEAELVAKRAQELAPEEPVVQQLRWQSRFVRRITEFQEIQDAKARGVEDALTSVDRSSTPFDDSRPIAFLDAQSWKDLTDRRGAIRAERRRSEKEIEIEQKLRTPVSLRFRETPLSEVMDYLARLARVNIHLDPQGLALEGVNTNTPVTIDLPDDISLRSALNLILQPLRLSYVIKDEVLKVTSQELRDGEVYTVTYNVADLVIPIPNFVPNGNGGLGDAIHNAFRNAGHYSGSLTPAAPMAVLAANGSSATISPTALAQVTPPGGMGFGQPPAGRGALGNGPGGVGGGSMADFDSLIELITTTVAPQTWDSVGGPGSIAPFANNLSLVVSQTQEVHEQIADLLQQLRRLQDLQVTIEVRFITLNDNFFERIGIDFDFDIDDDIDRPFQVFGRPDPRFNGGFTDPNALNVNSTLPGRDINDRDHGRSVLVGMSAPGVFSADLDIPVQQGSFPLAIPQFGGFQPGAGATLGFAILSDLEAYFFIEASEGDQRTNVLQAPKVTLFNGQQATISDQSQTPFVISVIPVVGDFAALQQPVVAVLSEGTNLTVQAVASEDRRFVRLTVVPFFSTIGKVNEFTFDGSNSTSLNARTPEDFLAGRNNATVIQRQGTTVQLPTFSFISVTTTVSVPDGGTVLLGGIKRLSEGRSEFGVPILSKVPYVNRLFRNSAIGRETQSLMMMVTPRIIIQEEEERLLLGE
jgi:general secretion pathway protein D